MWGEGVGCAHEKTRFGWRQSEAGLSKDHLVMKSVPKNLFSVERVRESLSTDSVDSVTCIYHILRILRKEVIQPQVPLRLPCYDLVPIVELTFGTCLPCGLAQ